MHPNLLLAISFLLVFAVNAKVVRPPKKLAVSPPVSSGKSTTSTSSSKSIATKSIATKPRTSKAVKFAVTSSNVLNPITFPKPTATLRSTWSKVIQPKPPSTTPTTTGPPQTSAPPTSSSSVSPTPQTNCNPAIPLAVADPAPPPCPSGYSWPSLDQPPPIAGPWLSLVDQSKMPPAPPNGLDTTNNVANTNNYSPTNDPFCTWTFSGCLRTETDITVCPNPNAWGLTFDDGPQPPSPILYDYLASVNQKATLFIIGSRAIEFSSTLLKAYQAGHQLAVHTWSHPYLTTQSTETIIAEIKWTEMAIQAITGVRPRYFRAPHGDIDDRVRYIATALGYKIIQWNRDTLDWMLFSPQTYNMNPAWVDGNFSLWSTQDKNQGTGIITLEHDSSLDAVCEALKSYVIMNNAGWTPLPIADCLGDPNYYIEGGPPQQSSSLNSQSALATATAPNSTGIPITSAVPTQYRQPSSDALRLMGSVAVGLMGVLVVFVVAIGA